MKSTLPNDLVVAGMVLSLVGCDQKAGRVEMGISGLRPTTREFLEIHAASTSDRDVGLCELLATHDAGAGLYRVEKMVGVAEPSSPVTYIELDLVEPWSANAPEHPTGQVFGGPSADGKTIRLADIDAKVGEQLGIFLAKPDDRSNGAYRLSVLGVFHDRGEGYSNGQLFSLHPVSSDELAALVGTVADIAHSPDCPDVRPELPAEPEWTDTDVQMGGPEVKGTAVAAPNGPALSTQDTTK